MRRNILVGLLSLLMLNGCNSFYEKRDQFYRDYAPIDISADSLKNNIINTLIDAKISSDACLNQIPADTTHSNCAAEKRRAIATLMIASENVCINHRKTIYGNEAASNLSTGTMVNVFSGVATIASGEAAKSIYSALAMFFNAERSLINETIYKNLLASAVDEKIVDVRDRKAQAIYSKLFPQNANSDNYSYQQALLDFQDFHSSCSFMTGLRLALKEGTQDTPEKKIARLKKNLAEAQLELSNTSASLARNNLNEDSKAKVENSIAERIETINQALSRLESQ